ncbi:MAG: TrkH family potassium uptake protein [Magnetospirillum sp.]|nr:TrkH family potassium uptake protein [Magnetospirillum sp.]
MIDIRPVLFVNGFLLMVLAAAMGIPAAADFASGDPDWQVFLASALLTGFFGAVLAFGSRQEGRLTLATRQAFLLTVSSWLLSAACAALPFLFSELDLGLADGVFEAMSGLTTTGATVIVGLDHAPRGLLLWRALLQWLGGGGIIVMAVSILPLLRVGGMQLFKMETSDKSERIRPRISQVATVITAVYVGFTLLSGLAFWLAGMSVFDAACHAMSALSTGGFSTSDASLGNWGETAQWVAVASMLVGGSTFTLYVAPWKHGSKVLDDSQARWYLLFLGFFSLLLALWLWTVKGMAAGEAVRHGTFAVVSTVTATGFYATGLVAWGGFAQVVFFILVFIGGCTGSTSGGIKMFRWEVLFNVAGVHLRRLLHPHGVFVINFNRQPISEQVMRSVLGFVVMYFFTFAAFAVLLAVVGLDLVTALSGSAAALANAGPGLGEIIAPGGSYKLLPDAAKWVLAFEMMLGRLELFGVFVLLSRSFWRE